MEEHANTPVLAGTEARPLQRSERRSALPVPASAATGGVALAAATYLLVRILRRPRRARAAVRFGRGRNRIEIAGSRSFLVDVHVLKR
jgi:hypothetical protein